MKKIIEVTIGLLRGFIVLTVALSLYSLCYEIKVGKELLDFKKESYNSGKYIENYKDTKSVAKSEIYAADEQVEGYKGELYLQCIIVIMIIIFLMFEKIEANIVNRLSN